MLFYKAEKAEKMSKNETLALIIEHLVSQGYSDADRFVNYVTMVLPMMSTEDLQAELSLLEMFA
jgi:hypothetical protein